MRSGVPTLLEYIDAVRSPRFQQMEEFSRAFLARHEEQLADYARRWVPDPLHHWSRQWEYPFVLAQIEDHLSRRDRSARIEVLDAGSGITFFPFFLARNWEGVRVRCCDVDETLFPVYREINRARAESVELGVCDLRDTVYPGSSFDVVLSISVLEHTKAFDVIAEEFARILKPGGLLVLTIDVGLDGVSELAPEIAGELLAAFRRPFVSADDGRSSPPLDSELARPGILTTAEVADRWPQRLPWRDSLVRRLAGKLGLRGAAGRSYSRLLTVYGARFNARGAGSSPASGGPDG